ncbi:hypothetical protein, partial [Klebsiella pneumoniae]|uniref:hypothetical protein n=1 Tax=Klebsiella pneumoniae TaxID=573 RepID=UPI0026EAB786
TQGRIELGPVYGQGFAKLIRRKTMPVVLRVSLHRLNQQRPDIDARHTCGHTSQYPKHPIVVLGMTNRLGTRHWHECT